MLVDRKIKAAAPDTRGTGKMKGRQVGSEAYDNYYSRLIKLIPSEVIAFYLALDAIVSVMPQKNILLWVVFGIALVGAWFYLGRLANVTGITQRLITLLAFAIWVFVFGGPFALLPWYNVNYGKILLVVFTFFVPVIFKGEMRDEGQGTRDK